ANTIPAAAFPDLVGAQVRTDVALDNPVLICKRKFLERAMDVDLSLDCACEQILLALAHLPGLKRLHNALRNAQAPVRHRSIQINSNNAAETSACRTCPERIVERKQTGCRWADVQVAVGTMPSSGKSMFLQRLKCHDRDLSLAVSERNFNGLD